MPNLDAAEIPKLRDRGCAYLGLTDHSQSAHCTGGLKTHEVIIKQAKIEKLNRGFKKNFRVFRGIESDILRNASLDYPIDILARFDLVIASVHSHFRMSKKEQTARIIKAGYKTILGHVTGRQLLRRPCYDVELETILTACADHGVTIEINAHPWRLELDWRWCERALELGCLFSIGPDAHSTHEVDNIHWGIFMARKVGVPKERVLNTFDFQAFALYLKKRPQRRKSRPELRKSGDAVAR